MSNKLNRQQTEAKINVHAWKNPAFKEKLKADPHSALRELGMCKIPESLNIITEEEGKNQWIIRLSERPSNFTQLSDEALEKVAAGEPQEVKCCPKKPK